ncbi:GPP34 family phosphoprotein [Isoptericola sp. F-RaC21]|uniref:GOLPH3/VPS74 family protein n=1 Tax=Isoptericola sp. F-RaC21 TaxID=3141452 RepID=UPI00315BCBF9
MIIAEDLLLLAYDDESGKPTGDHAQLDYRLAGALLVQLAVEGRVDVAQTDLVRPDGSRVKAGRAVVRDGSPTGHPALDRALAVVAEKPRTPKDLVVPLSKGLRDALLAGLAGRGVLRRESGKVLGIFPTTSWPTADATHEQRLRALCREVLLGSRVPDDRTAALIAVAHGSGLVRGLVAKGDRARAEARAKELAEQSWASEAVRKAVDEMVAAVVLTAVIIPATTATMMTS